MYWRYKVFNNIRNDMVGSVVFLATFTLLAVLTKIGEVALTGGRPIGGAIGALFITIWLPLAIYVSWRVSGRVIKW